MKFPLVPCAWLAIAACAAPAPRQSTRSLTSGPSTIRLDVRAAGTAHLDSARIEVEGNSTWLVGTLRGTGLAPAVRRGLDVTIFDAAGGVLGSAHHVADLEAPRARNRPIERATLRVPLADLNRIARIELHLGRAP